MDSLPNACFNISSVSEKVFPNFRTKSDTDTLLVKIGHFLNNRKIAVRTRDLFTPADGTRRVNKIESCD
jgi:hypothetical protein